MYWASATTVSVGYGDIHAHTDVEVSKINTHTCTCTCTLYSILSLNEFNSKLAIFRLLTFFCYPDNLLVNINII